MNWKLLIKELSDAGWTQARIAKECKTGQSYISSLYNRKRKTPNWDLGDALIRLHKKACRKNKKAA